MVFLGEYKYIYDGDGTAANVGLESLTWS